ncbi:metallophosphoesterase [Halapricum hydrolyticum]|uniref:Metallophosphoesterase n=1 Tax=Halapricum hydrolyticum TaxID=2979991 RepID=A0AAE3LI87_9EURY|nr:metallophosphoesterase [Halapricum hydrolyticum]MCU4718635.1 metallophosphoesterase [Halapricum hydrolyticum]MCU4727679.1 metallophosphoesterase [Halapricum hydrolyticum]
MVVEPIPDAPAAVVDTGEGRALAVADYHAGLESHLRREGVELDPADEQRREQLLSLLAESDPDRLVLLGDLATSIGEPTGEERAEIEALLEAVSVPITIVKGNHDGEIESVVGDQRDVTVTDGEGTRIGSVGFAHGHTWPAPAVLEAEIVCVAHEHPVVRLEDEVGGARAERVWLRGRVEPGPFRDHFGDRLGTVSAEMVVFPAFNDRSGGTWVNVEGRDFLSPFLPAGLADGEAYLLDGTRLGPYQRL